MVLISRPPPTLGCALGTRAESCSRPRPRSASGRRGRPPCPRLISRFSHVLPPPERCLEDHELVVQVESTMAGDSKFLFRKNYAKYEFFKNPTVSVISSGSGRGTFS